MAGIRIFFRIAQPANERMRRCSRFVKHANVSADIHALLGYSQELIAARRQQTFDAFIKFGAVRMSKNTVCTYLIF